MSSYFVQQASAQEELTGGTTTMPPATEEEGEPDVIDEPSAVTEEQPPTTPEEQQQPLTATTEEGQQPLLASFTIDSTNGDTAPASFLFEAEAEGGTEPYTWHWDFGDGQQGNVQIMTHTFQNPGTYTVILTVTDSAGQTATDTEQVTAQPPADGQQPPSTNATTTTLLLPTNNQTISNATIVAENNTVVNALLSALVALSTNDTLQEAILTDGGGGANVSSLVADTSEGKTVCITWHSINKTICFIDMEVKECEYDPGPPRSIICF